MGIKEQTAHQLAQLGSLAVQASATPRSLLGQIQAECATLGISGPVCWISPREAFSDSARETACTDGSLVQTMRDITGNGYNAAQATSGYRPTFRATGISNQFPALDFQAQNLPNGGMVVSNLFSAAAFSAGYTIYAVATSPGIANVNPANELGISELLGLSNGDYISLQEGTGNEFAATFNGGATGIVFNPAAGTSQDCSGVYVMAYDGVTAAMGKNGQIKTAAIAGTAPTSGSLCIGNSYSGIGASSGSILTWTGLVGDVLVFAGRHTLAQINAISALLSDDSGLVPPAFIAVGDSRSLGYNLASPSTMNWFAQMCSDLGANSSNALLVNFGDSGETLEEMVSDNATSPWLRSGVVLPARGNQNIAFIWAGINSMSAGGNNESAPVAFASLQTLCAAYRSSGCKVAVGTELPASASTAGAGYDAKRLAFNQLIYAAGTSLYDILMDFGASPIMGPASALTNTALYQGDQIHPTEQGQAVLKEIAVAAVAAYYSETPILQIPGNVWPAGAYPGNPQMQLSPVTLQGTTTGVVSWTMPDQSPDKKKFIAEFNGYENHTASNQTITFPTPFVNTPVVLGSLAGLTVSASTTTFTITSPDSTSTFSGTIIVEGV